MSTLHKLDVSRRKNDVQIGSVGLSKEHLRLESF